MLNPRTLDEVVKRVAEMLPAGLGQLQADFEKNLRAALGVALAKADLVTREEFDVQRAVLARTREKLTALERQVAELETGPTRTREGARD